jgi:site-specific DNA-methyltransferase (adenine-specific)
MNLRLENKDCMEVMAEYPDKYFDFSISDFPYGIGEDGKKNHSRGKLTKPTFYTPKEWDKKTPENKLFDLLFSKVKHYFIFGANYYKYLPYGVFKTPRRREIKEFIEKYPKNLLLWDKDNGDFKFNDYEIAYTNLDIPTQIIKFRWNGMLQENMKNKETRIHPTQKPVSLYLQILQRFTTNGIKYTDFTLGSGSSLIAADNFGVAEFVGCEIDKEYFDQIQLRYKIYKMQQKLF